MERNFSLIFGRKFIQYDGQNFNQFLSHYHFSDHFKNCLYEIIECSQPEKISLVHVVDTIFFNENKFELFLLLTTGALDS